MNHSLITTFQTPPGIPVPAISTVQMQEIDRIAMEETGPNLFQMMENAGRNLAVAAMEMLGNGWRQANYVVLAGTGGNGGGGICAARHLANRSLKVSLCLSDPQRLSEVPAFQRHVFQSTSGKEVSLPDLSAWPVDLIIDAIIGYSLRSAPRGAALQMIRWANAHSAPVLSLDVPSGVDATTGQSAGEYIRADRTVTLALPKTGLLPEKTGELFLADIGIPAAVYRKMGLQFENPFGSEYLIRLQPCTK